MVQRGYRITGRVQGVFFRAWTQEVAGGLGLRGTVRNRLDGSVEAHAVGPRGAMGVLEGRLRLGPPAALVERVEELPSSGALPPAPFRVLPTGP